MLGPLISELQRVATNPPSTTVSNLVIDTELLQLSLSSVSTQFVTGLVRTNVVPYLGAAGAISNMAQHLVQLGLEMGLPRLFHAATNLQAISGGFSFPAAVVTNGPVDTDQGHQHNFYWGLQNRAGPEWRQAASALAPHVRVNVPINNWGWPLSTIEPVRVKIQDRTTSEVLEDFYVPLSERSFFDVFYMLPENLPVNLWFKLPTHLSEVIVTNLQDGLAINAAPPIPGDANGDNCIDTLDFQQVLQDSHNPNTGGGSNAVSVSSSDVNGDGVVDMQDVTIVQINLGRCGQSLNRPLLKFNYNLNNNGILDLYYPFEFHLESTPAIGSNWSSFLGQPEVLGSSYHLSVGPGGGCQFFRARSP